MRRNTSGCTVPTPTVVARSRIQKINQSTPSQQPCMSTIYPTRQLLPQQGINSPQVMYVVGINEQQQHVSSKLRFFSQTTKTAITTNRYEKKKKNCDFCWTRRTFVVVAVIVTGGWFVAVSFIYNVVVLGTIQLPVSIPHLTPISTISQSNIDHRTEDNRKGMKEGVHQGDVSRSATVDSNHSLMMYDYDVLVSLYNSTDRIPDPEVVPYPNQQFIIFVMSQRNHHQRRTMIRQTWGRTYAKSLLFIIGGESATSNQLNPTSFSDESIISVQQQKEQLNLLRKEQILYHDLLDTIHPESYRSLPHKLRFAIHWVTNKMQQQQPTSPMLQWILKVDDDMYVRDIQHFTTSSLDEATVPIVMGCIQYHIPVQRYGKWAENSWFYERYPIYPPWPKGSCGYIFNHAVAKIITQKYNQDIQMMNHYHVQPSKIQRTSKKRLSDESSRSTHEQHYDRQSLLLPSYQGEDTSFGIWLQHSNITWIDSPFFVNHGNCDAMPHHDDTFHSVKPLTKLVGDPDVNEIGIRIEIKNTTTVPWCIGHRMTPEQIQNCYNIENLNIGNGTIPHAPFDFTLRFLDASAQKHDFQLTNDNNTAYAVAMMHHEADQKRLQRQHEIEERLERRNKIKQLRNHHHA